MNLRIIPPDEMLEVSITLPLSKSMSARALIINKIGGFEPVIELSDSDDTKALAEGLSITSGKVDIGASGTAMRFLTAYYAATEGTDVILDGNERMRQRPIGILVEALRHIGADIEYCAEEGFPPIHIRGNKLSGGEVQLDPSVSSQFISALMMTAPLMMSPFAIRYEGEPSSLPYLKMTAGMMEEAGVSPEFRYNGIEIPNTPYTQPIVKIERDWSAASYWYSITALSAGWVTLEDMQMNSLQGDSLIKEMGSRIGVITSESEETENAVELSASPEQFSRLEVDMSGTPDLVPTLAVTSAILGIPFRFTGVRSLRAKETDRIEALKNEALKFGMIFENEGDNILFWEGKRVPMHELPRFCTYGDHRMAMALAPLAIFVPGIVIEDSDVVTKSYPGYWKDLQKAGFKFIDGDVPLPEMPSEE